MSCPCPSGYTPTIDSDDCIYTVTAATSGGTSFYTATTAVNNTAYNGFGVIFYDDITNFSFPLFNTGTTSTVYTQNGYPLTNTQYIVDQNGVIPNILAGGQGIMTSPSSGPPYLVSNLWGNGTVGSGRLNNAGIWATSVSPSPPFNEYIGFTHCLDIPVGGTYYIGLSGDDLWRFKINGELIYDSISNFPGTSLGSFTINTAFHQIFPYYFNSGLNIIEMECLNLGVAGGFVAEIYTGSVATLSAYTTTTQLSADTIFSTLDFIGQNIPLSNSGYTCPSGYTLYNCSGSPYCILIDRQPIVNYCVSDTGLGYDDYFKYGGIHNGEPYWSGETNGYVIFYSTNSTWCLSTVLNGACLLEGKFPCTSECPDLCDTYVFSGSSCPTPTPTPTINCATLNFEAIFDCEVSPTPSVTPTNTVTPTVTPTPTSSPLCPFINVDVTITGYTPTPTPTPTITPSNTPEITRPCDITGNVTYSTLDNKIICPASRKFVDCSNGQFYFTDNYLATPSGDTLTPLLLFKANVDGLSKCIVYLGLDLNTSGINTIELIDGPLGDLNIIADCSPCTPDPSPTPTPSPTVTPTLSATPNPTPLPAVGYYTYNECLTDTYVIQNLPGPTTTSGQIFKTSLDSSGTCWNFVSFTTVYPSLPPGANITYYIGNYYPTSGITYFTGCKNCGLNITGSTTNILI